ncbi:SGNH hydrolase domain-containing protein [Nocardioides campestrisoli]|uniref:SGNH hydrolase domain-containing protein n=1 Tax=Nocardioides campestrisoli TaxID=2736757 RepID=UPI0015E6E59A|nr:SGNH hydrolase domain-containing protein [Nocardioides campestrisoli]
MPLRAPVALLTALILLCLAGCTDDSGDSGPAQEPAAPTVSVAPAAPDPETVADEVKRGARLSELPEEFLPAVPFVAQGNSLTDVQQSCVLSYLAVERETPCVLGDPEADREVVLWGDAHAAQWIAALERAGREQGWRVLVRTKYGCPPLLGVTPWLEAEERPYEECVEFNERTAEMLPDSEDDVVLLAGSPRGLALVVDGRPQPVGVPAQGQGWRSVPAQDRAYQEGLGASLEAAAERGPRTVVLGDTPYPGHDAQACLTANPGALGACAAPRKEAVLEGHNARLAKTARKQGASYVDPVPWFCTDRVCPAIVAERVVYRDGFTAGRLYVDYLTDVLGEAVGLMD